MTEKPPIFCDIGTMIRQNLPRALCNIGYHVDSGLPPGTLEIWQDGKRLCRVINIGIKCTCHSEPGEDGRLHLIQCPKCGSQPLDEYA